MHAVSAARRCVGHKSLGNIHSYTRELIAGNMAYILPSILMISSYVYWRHFLADLGGIVVTVRVGKTRVDAAFYFISCVRCKVYRE
jgi:hypothetical protein